MVLGIEPEAFYVSQFSITMTKVAENHLIRKKGLFWLAVLGVSV